ncbi:hypothetical protein S1361_17490 [Streptomyces cyanogenus]|uniref:Lipoprotein n=2 Tax=Streptomyces cyanogenus TaxID=80860 RepID=A0ABX7TU21_STRCY|nr:hypothetical protein S1361_17490 [Streptomyces cyanogenus]
MGLDSVRAVSQVVGRRTTLRYLAVGVGASLLAACKGNDDGKGGTTEGEGGSGGTSPAPGVTGKAFAAFVRGSWKVTSEMPGGDTYTYSVTVTDGVWTMDLGEGKSAKGTWALGNGRLALQVPERLGDTGADLQNAGAENVPASVGDSVSLGLPWQPPGASGTGAGERLEVEYDKKAGMRIRHTEQSGSMTVHHCVRV